MATRNPAPIAPVPPIAPPPPGRVRTATPETDMEALRAGVASGLLSGSEAGLYRSLRPVSHGAGRPRMRGTAGNLLDLGIDGEHAE